MVTTAKVAYGSMSPDCQAPGDRRRFAGFAVRHGLDFGLLPDQDRGNDIVVMTLGSDLSVWRRLKSQNEAVVIDLVDAYLDEPVLSFRRMFRGGYKSLTRQIQRPTIRYTKMLERALSGVDGVVCASQEQMARLRQYNSNVHVVVDCLEELFEEIPAMPLRMNEVRLLWEGFPENLQHFTSVVTQLRGLTRLMSVTIEVVTDLSGRRRGASTYLRNFTNLMTKNGIVTEFKPWSVEQLKMSVKKCDFAIIPIDHEDPMAWGKSENKLLSFWSMGLPALVSPTPSYRRLVDELREDLPVCTEAQWTDIILSRRRDPETLLQYRESVVTFARERCSERATDLRWVNILESVRDGVGS
jgi:hypothetical protein